MTNETNGVEYLKPKKMKKYLITLLLLIFGFIHTNAQNEKLPEKLKKQYLGEWYSKKDKRTITIFYDEEYDYYVVNDHTKGYSDEAYKVYAKANKLVSYAENNDHHKSYCEMNIVNGQLVYECNSGLNFTDNFLNRDKYSYRTVFKKRKK